MNPEAEATHRELKELHNEKLKIIEEMREAGVEYVVEDYFDPDDEVDLEDKDEITIAKSIVDESIEDTERDDQ